MEFFMITFTSPFSKNKTDNLYRSVLFKAGNYNENTRSHFQHHATQKECFHLICAYSFLYWNGYTKYTIIFFFFSIYILSGMVMETRPFSYIPVSSFCKFDFRTSLPCFILCFPVSTSVFVGLSLLYIFSQKLKFI